MSRRTPSGLAALIAALLVLADGTGPAVAWTGIEAVGTEATRRQAQFDLRRRALRRYDRAAEEARLRALHARAWGDPGLFGTRVRRGFLVKRLGGDVIAEHRSGARFQPLSMMKILPYHAAVYYSDRGFWRALESEGVSWVVGRDPEGGGVEHPCAAVLYADPFEQPARWTTWPLVDALPTMMYNSDNVIYEALLRKMTPHDLNIFARRVIGMRGTRIHFGCGDAEDPRPWARNVTTLRDMSALLESVGPARFTQSGAQFFLDNLVVADEDPSTFYESPIRETRWGFGTPRLRRIVEREALRSGRERSVVAAFMRRVRLRSKGGSGGPDGSNYGENNLLLAELPVYDQETGDIGVSRYVVGYFTERVRWPADCAAPGCDAEMAPSREAHGRLQAELLAFPVHWALRTWPTRVAPPRPTPGRGPLPDVSGGSGARSPRAPQPRSRTLSGSRSGRSRIERRRRAGTTRRDEARS